jgi:hypothetical protein
MARPDKKTVKEVNVTSDYSQQWQLEVLIHKNKMEEIKAQIDGEKEVEKLKFDSQLQLHRLKRKDILTTLETKRQHQDAYLDRIEQKDKEKST